MITSRPEIMEDRFVEISALVIAASGLLACGGTGHVDYFEPSGTQPSSVVNGGNSGDNAGSTFLSGSGGNGGVSGSSSSGGSGAGGNGGIGGSGGVGGSSSGGSFASTGGAEEAGSSGVAGSNDAGAGGGPSSEADDPPCSPVMEGVNGASGPFGTLGPSCWRVSADITGWGCNNAQGRTVHVNGTEVRCGQLPLPEKLHGDYYFEFSAGDHEYADFYWF